MSKCVGKKAVLVPEVKACIQLNAQRMQEYLNNYLICQINPLCHEIDEAKYSTGNGSQECSLAVI